MPVPGMYKDPQPSEVPKGRAALFLDRDGVINVDHGYVCSVAKTEWTDGIFELCRGAKRLGYRIFVVTNQAGIARGYYTEEEFLAYTRWLHEIFRHNGARIEATIYCPHHPDAGIGELKVVCICRKPAPGMLLAAADEFALDLTISALVGDRESDIEAGRAAGVQRLYRVTPVDGEGSSSTPPLGWRLKSILADLRNNC